MYQPRVMVTFVDEKESRVIDEVEMASTLLPPISFSGSRLRLEDKEWLVATQKPATIAEGRRTGALTLYLILPPEPTSRGPKGDPGDLRRAKELFFDYACMHGFMANDDVYEDYKLFGITPAQEAEWRKEYIEYWVSRLSVDPIKAVDKLDFASAVEALPDLTAMAHEGDSFAKTWRANAIDRLALCARTEHVQKLEAKRVATEVWRSVVAGPIELTEESRATLEEWVRAGALGASTPEEYVLKYARGNLGLE